MRKTNRLIAIIAMIMISVSLFSCADMNNTKDNETEDTTTTDTGSVAKKVRNPVFTNLSNSRAVIFDPLENPADLYFLMFCPSIMSFDSDDEISAGDTFTRMILNTPVTFKTTVEGDVVSYSGKSDDGNITVNISYNEKTERITYDQILCYDEPDRENGKHESYFAETEFDGTINSKDSIHAKANYTMVICNRDSSVYGMGGYTWGETEFYLGKDEQNKPLAGFFLYSLINSGFADDIEPYTSTNPSLKTEIKQAIKALEDEGYTPQEVYSYGLNKNGTVEIPLDGGSLVADYEKETFVDKVPWTLFD